jgi:predicted glycoside hydrolase/deacetylase ChbG (UPF0249 family)
MLLTISADDFGLHPEIDAGILDLIEKDIIAAISVLIHSPNLDLENVRTAQKAKVAVGVHLAFTEMSPVCPGLQLSPPWGNSDGSFRTHWSDLRIPLLTRKVPQALVEKEWLAQVEKFKDLFGLPDFLDSHQNLHLIWPFTKIAHKVLIKNEIGGLRVFYDQLELHNIFSSLVCYVGKKLIPKEAHLPTYGLFSSGNLTFDSLAKTIASARKIHKHIVLATHPGLSACLSQGHKHHPKYQLSWRKEYELLSSIKFQDFLRQEGIKLARLDGSVL